MQHPLRWCLLHYVVELYASLIKGKKQLKVPPVLPVLVYNGTHHWTAARSMKELMSPAVNAHVIPKFRYNVIEIRKFDEKARLDIGKL